MTCKDCIHYEACKSIYLSMGFAVGEPQEQEGDPCEHFADKSLYIKLPCKMGDELIIIGECGGCALDITGVKMPVVWQAGEEAEAALEGRMSDLIDRKALIERLGKSHEYHARNSREEVLLYRDIRIINEAPAVAAVEVVRCKDCKHFTKFMAIGMCKYEADKPLMPIRYDDFCSYGERRTE